MKKRGFFNLLVVAVLTVAAGTLYSCKDYDEELRAELEEQIGGQIEESTKLNEVVNVQIDRINDLIKQMEAAKEACKAELEKINAKFDDYLTKSEAAETYVTKAEFNKKVDEFTGIIAGLNSTIAGINGQLDALDKARIDAERRLDALEAAKKQTEDRLDAIEDAAQRDSIIISLHTTQITELYTLVNELQRQQTTTIETITTIQNNLGKLEENVTKLGENLDEFKQQVGGDIEQLKEDLKKTQDNLDKLEKTLSAKIDKLKEDIKKEIIDPAIEKVNAEIGKVSSVADQNKKNIAALDSIYQKIQSDKVITDSIFTHRIDSLSGVTADLADELHLTDSLVRAKVDSAVHFTDSLVTLAVEKTDSLGLRVDTAFQEIGKVQVDLRDLKTSMNHVTDSLGKEIAGVATDLAALETKVLANTAKINELNSMFQSVMKKMITSLNINGAYSPVVGYFNLPTGMKSNILAAFYGYADHKGGFPAVVGTLPALNMLSGDTLTRREAELLGLTAPIETWENNACLMEKGEANAGHMYVTVNPVNITPLDLVGTKFKLVASNGEESYAKLGTPVKSDHKLAFGYTRAGKNNGFYEIPASISEEQVEKSKLRLDMDKIKEAVKDVLTPDDGVNITNVATTLYTQINDIADAYALEATWSDDSLGEHSVYSDYGIAAIGVKPLSYEFMKDFHRDHFWGIDKAYKLLDKILDKANSVTDKIVAQFPQFVLNIPNIDTIVIDTLTDDLLAEFIISYTDTICDTIEIHHEVVLDKMVPIDSVKVPDMTVEIKGQNITTNVDITIPAQNIEMWNPSKYDKDGNKVDKDHALYGDEPFIYMPDTVKVTIPGRTIYDQPVTVPTKDQNVTVTGKYIKFDDVHIVDTIPIDFSQVVKVPVHFEKDMSQAVKDLYGEMTGSITNVNVMLKDLKVFINEDLNNLLKELNGMKGNVEENLDEAMKDIHKDLSGFIEKIDKKLCSIVNSVHSKLQPVMFIKGNDEFVMLSSAKNVPTTSVGSFVLVPTTYTAELLTPAVKKFVAVTDVIKGNKSAKYDRDANLENILRAANNGNTGLNSVLPGRDLGIKVENLKSGYTYEFTYSALDFHGKIVNTKYYITVK